MFSTVAALAASLVLTNACQLAQACRTRTPDARFEITGRVTYPRRVHESLFALEDDSGAVILMASASLKGECPLLSGDIISVSGHCSFSFGGHRLARCNTIRKIGHAQAVAPQTVDVERLKSGAVDSRIIRIRGVVREVFLDEIDAGYIFMTLCCGRDTVYAACNTWHQGLKDLQPLTGADISIIGLCNDNDVGTRGQIGHLVNFKGLEAIEIHARPPDDPFLSPRLADMKNFDPEQVSLTGRRRLVGSVLAIWSGMRALLKDESGALHKVEFSCDSLPALGDAIEAVGMPETDLYHVNLASTSWRKYDGNLPAATSFEQVRFERLHTDDRGRPCINPLVHGKETTCIGQVLEIAVGPNDNRMLTLKVGDRSIPVDLYCLPNILKTTTVGCKARVSGICIVETETWRPYARFPHAKGITIVPRTDADLQILARPPWWTPARLMVVIGTLLAGLVGFFVWNRVLNRLVERRSRQLRREQEARAGEKLKVSERTRLAVELHDSLSQTLTGVSFQIDAAERARRTDPSRVGQYLEVARQTLQSCREELRNCLWDLRNNALEEPNAETAVRKTVEPHIGDAELSVDFSIPRKALSDNLFHAILCILRELATNAVRHGTARHVTLRGAISDTSLELSVEDNGCGFDPENRPGVDEGHFGLLGVAERIETLNGTLNIRSVPNHGTSIRISIPL